MILMLALSVALTSMPVNAGVALLYHHVDSATPPITSISPAQFARHLEILEEEGFQIVTLDALLEESFNGKPDARIAAITFDDAYQSIYTTAYPLLKSRNWPFTIFVATDFVSETNPLYLSWDQLREMSANGAHIAGHTNDHTHLIRRRSGESSRQWQVRITSNIERGMQTLQHNGFESQYFAYPYGEYNLEMLGMIAGMGLTAFGQQSGAIGPFANRQLLPRFPLAGVYVGEAAFRDKIQSLAMPVAFPLLEPLMESHYRPELTLLFKDVTVDMTRLTCYGPGGLMAIADTGPNRVKVTPMAPISVGRSRYNCTLPAGNRFYWFSQLWIRKLEDGSWYPEP